VLTACVRALAEAPLPKSSVVSRQLSAASPMVWMCVYVMWMRMVGSFVKQAALAGGGSATAGYIFLVALTNDRTGATIQRRCG